MTAGDYLLTCSVVVVHGNGRQTQEAYVNTDANMIDTSSLLMNNLTYDCVILSQIKIMK